MKSKTDSAARGRKERREGFDRRIMTFDRYVPERRSGNDRRSGKSANGLMAGS